MLYVVTPEVPRPSVENAAHMRRVVPVDYHPEKHTSAGQAVRDLVIGISDGLTVPFALAAGITGAIAATHTVVIAGIAEIVAGSISMGFGGYLAARTDIDRYASEYRREASETERMPDEERNEVATVFADYGIEGTQLDDLVNHIASDRERWVDFMMRFELRMEKPNPRQAPISAMTIGGAYAAGGLVPLFPYMIMSDVGSALALSATCTGVALLVFGVFKARFTGMPPVRGALQTLLIGGLSAAAAFGLTRLVH
jgi:vacuolar iron transporter family protein